MSHHTSLSVKYSGTSINFPPVQSCFELSLGKASSDAAGGGYISQPPSITSGVLPLNKLSTMASESSGFILCTESEQMLEEKDFFFAVTTSS